MEAMTYGAQVPYMPVEQAKIVRAGFSLFEIRTRDIRFFNQHIMGPYGVKIEEFIVPGAPRGRARATWRTGMDTSLCFDADNDGNCIAWMVDDPWWHNRLHLMLDPWAQNLSGRHGPQGVTPGFIVKIEIQAMYNVLRETLPTFEVLQDGKFKHWFFTQKEADEFIEGKQTYELKTDSKGALKNIPLNKANYKIRPGTVSEYKPEIKNLIDKSRGLRYGWTSSEDFKNIWRPIILKEFDNLKAKAEPPRSSVTPNDLAAAIRNWSPEERAKFNEMMMGRPAEAPQPEEVAEDISAAPVATTPPATTPESSPAKYTKSQLMKMKLDDLKVINGTDEDLTKNELVDKILHFQDVKGVVVE